ncbi:type I-U CRISPR-associated helicase/endonuclease Cas3 [Kitasatospora sp. NPDC058046]|uniref:type I-G CRISPR-associated helicase/endonuclease Cas3g n=1 Tax=Kitasatospora sp. NPDC058046 TaxID=3346312 RepID=UPI0036DDF0B7
MTTLAQDFTRYVREIHHHAHCPPTTRAANCRACRSYRPFPWQLRYLKAAAGGRWPDLAIPTGLGKTSLVDIWLFLLARQADLGAQRRVPLRLVTVVDRRLVVDQTFEHARQLVRALEEAEAGSDLAGAAAALRRLAHGPTPLVTARMRGGQQWASRWLTNPAQPAVAVSTIDQAGSRLLLRSYQDSPRWAPIEAGLIGIDALWAIDEAHLAQALLATATDCAAEQTTATDSVLADRALTALAMTATIGTGADARDALSVVDDDRADPVAGPRLNARRTVSLLDASGWSRDSADAFARAAEQCLELVLPHLELPAVAVVANTISHARAAHRRLATRKDIDVLLLIGRCRSAERDLLRTGTLAELLAGIAPARPRPLVVIATQTIEVGLDISTGALISENADLTALVQRLGRLDRYGTLTSAPCTVIRASTGTEPRMIPVYGQAAHYTWQWLTTLTPVRTHPGQQLPHDAVVINPTTLPELLADTDTTTLRCGGPHIPRLHRRLIDTFTHTAPQPQPPEAPGPFLHGLTTAPPDVDVLWRADLTAPDTAHWTDRLRQNPPHPAETVTVPVTALRRLLTAQSPGDTSDLEGADSTETPPPGTHRLADLVLQREADGTWQPVTDPARIRPGATVVLPSAFGGHDAYGWTGHPGQPVPDLADHPPATTATTPLRADPHVLASTSGIDTALFATPITAAVTALQDNDSQPPPSPTRIVHTLLDTLADLLPDTAPTDQAQRFAPLLRHRLHALRQVPAWSSTDTTRGRDRRHGLFLIEDGPGPRLLLIPPNTGLAAAIDDEESDASSLTRPVALTTHHHQVGRRSRDYANALNLPEPLVRATELAGQGHDWGKLHRRFQGMLCQGDTLYAESLNAPLAKSGTDPADRAGRRAAARLAGWDPRLRHEALSAAVMKTWLATDPPAARGCDHELVTHLVAAHHGHARPLLPETPDPNPVAITCRMPDHRTVTVSSTAIGTDWSHPDAFQALTRRYGPWGLALLETVVRLADIACSQEGT